jgi:hypothetical protein
VFFEQEDTIQNIATPDIVVHHSGMSVRQSPEEKERERGQGLTGDKMRDCIWVQPKLVANFEFLECALRE